ncbi:unnamed protein product, partial [Symbiodinium sp. CCMP2456]
MALRATAPAFLPGHPWRGSWKTRSAAKLECWSLCKAIQILTEAGVNAAEDSRLLRMVQGCVVTAHRRLRSKLPELHREPPQKQEVATPKATPVVEATPKELELEPPWKATASKELAAALKAEDVSAIERVLASCGSVLNEVQKNRARQKLALLA